MQVGTVTGGMFERLSESYVFVHDAVCLFMYALVFLSVFLLKIGGDLAKMAGCLHRCVAAFTCQLLVEVVSSLMTRGADSVSLLCLPRCRFLRPVSPSPPGEKQLQLNTEMSVARKHKLFPEMQLGVVQVFVMALL